MRSAVLIALFGATLIGCQCGGPITTGDPNNSPPVARILSPSDGAALPSAGPYTLVGDGSDAEDGALSGSSLVWSSDLDGPLGSGGSISTPLRQGLHRISLDVTDSKGGTGRAQISITVGGSGGDGGTGLPVVVIEQPADNAFVDQGTVVTLLGHANDPEDGALTGAALSWSSDKAGALGTGASVAFTPTIVGAHRIVLTATDSGGNSAYATITLNVVLPGANRPPVVSITQPSNNTQVTAGAQVTFSGTATDPEDGVLTGTKLSWRSNVGGALGTGTTFSTSALQQGTHVITLTATDNDGLAASASINLSVNAPNNQSPTAIITAPANNTTVFQGSSVTLTGTGTDPEDGTLTGTALSWSSNRDGALGTGGSLTTTSLTVGTHTLTLTAKDSGNNTGTASITLNVLPQNQAPTVTITSPANGASFVAGTTVQLRGSASDPEDGALSGASLTWRSDVAGILGTGASVDTSSLAVGQHAISLTALDSGGRSANASRTITITQAPVNLAPIARLTGPTSGVVAQGLPFSGATSSDPDGTLVEYTFNFGDGSAAQVGTSATATHAYASAGTFTVTLTVKDNGGLTHSTTLLVVISAGVRVPTVVDARTDRLGTTCQIGAKNGVVQVGFRDITHPSLWYGTLSGGTFTSELVDGMGFGVGGEVEDPFAMVVDNAGAPHFVYSVTGKGLFYATKTTGGWVVERIDRTVAATTNLATIALDPANGNRPTVAYTAVSPTYNRIIVAARTGVNTWTNTTVSFGFTTGNQSLSGELLIDSAGKLYLPLNSYWLGTWNGTTTEYFSVYNATGNNAYFASWSPAVFRSANVAAYLTSMGVLDVTLGTPLSSSTVSVSLVEDFGTSQHGLDVSAGGSPHLVVNHGSDLEVVTVGAGGFWTRQSLGSTDSGRIDAAVDAAGQTRACFYRAGKLVVY